MAGTFFAARAYPNTGVGSSVGSASSSGLYYVVDKGFEGAERTTGGGALEHYGAARVVCPPERDAREVWPKRLRRWVAGIRQIIETVYYEKLFNTFGLWEERPHELQGLRAR